MIVSVIIVTYNGMQWLERCLASVPESYELVIVDNQQGFTRTGITGNGLALLAGRGGAAKPGQHDGQAKFATLAGHAAYLDISAHNVC